MQDLTYTATRDESIRRIAYLQEGNGDEDAGAGWTIHGVALAPELTHPAVDGEARDVEWPESVLEAAAESLEDRPIVARHTDDDDGQIQFPPPQELVEGRVTKAAYEPGAGVIYEATIADPDIARKVEAGVLDVSPEVAFNVEDPSADPLVATEAQFAALAIVSIGGGPSNTAEPGPHEALASLSAAGIHAILEASAPDDPDSDGPEGEVADGNSTETTGAATGTEPGSPVDDTDSDMGDNPDDPSVSDLLDRLDEKDDQIATLEDEKEELADKNATLAERNETLEGEIGEVKEAYAAVLSEEGPFDEDDLIENFDVATLREKFEDRFEDGFAATLAQPDIQSGADGGSDGGGDGPTDDDVRERIETIDAKLSAMGNSLPADRVATLREEACELADVDDYDAAIQVINE